MKEVVDVKDNIKMVAMILGGICYDGHEYLLYSIKRSRDEANLFVSKLVRTSDGYHIQHDFQNGEKEVLDKVVQRIISREPAASLEKDGYSFIKNVSLVGVSSFDVHLCYVATVPVHLVKECMVQYGFMSENIFNEPVVELKEEKKFNQGFVGNLFLIVFGILILIFSVSVVISTFTHKG